MLFERIESKGLSHYSYLLGDGREACVIDPRRDCDVYVRRAAEEGMRITTILETHRNEDYVVGSLELAVRSGGQVWHADSHLDYSYGQPAHDGQTWKVGRLALRAILSPGHTLGSMSYLLRDPDGRPWVVFSGDALFAGDVGRVDFLGPDRSEEMARLLYDTVFERLLPLGDEVMVCPAHGSGSACGAAIADRAWTTIGLERRYSPKLQNADQTAFVAAVAKVLEQAPYFRRMESLNLTGAPPLGQLAIPTPLAPPEFASQARHSTVLDVRDPLSFAAAHVPDAISIWERVLPSYGGWFLPYDRPLLLVSHTDDLDQAVRFLARIGYDDVKGALAGGMVAWLASGRESTSIETITTRGLRRLLAAGDDVFVLDVRSAGEVAQSGVIPGAYHLHVTQLPERLAELPADRAVCVVCASGVRATTAASLLTRGGFAPDRVSVLRGGMNAWNAGADAPR